MQVRQQIKEINFVRIAVEVMSISGVVLAFCWGIAVTKGNEIWASRDKTDDSIRAITENIHRMQIDASQHMTREEVRTNFVTKDTMGEFKDQFLDFAKEQRAVNREILQRLPTK